MSIIRFVAVVALLGLAAVIGVTVYNAGVAAGLADAAHTAIASGDPATVVYYPGWGPGYHGFGWGFGFFGFFFLIFGFFIVIGLLRAAFGRGHGYSHGYGYGGWKGRAGPRDYLEDWHKEAHGSPPAPDKTS